MYIWIHDKYSSTRFKQRLWRRKIVLIWQNQFFKIMSVTVVQWLRSYLHLQVNRVRLPVTLFSVSLYRFFFPPFGLFFFNTIFPFGLVFFILTSEPAGHALGSIYTLSLSPEFYFGKGISKALDLHTGLAYSTPSYNFSIYNETSSSEKDLQNVEEPGTSTSLATTHNSRKGKSKSTSKQPTVKRSKRQ